MNQTRSCPKCGDSLPADAPAGLCPKCLLQGGLASEGTQDAAASRFEPPSAAELAKRFPQLEILELLGQGGMGAVYKARQPGLDRRVAVKILPPQVGRDPSFAERFSREARALARLSHPNIVGVHDFGQADGLYYFVMEYIDGASLREAIAAGGLKPDEALAIVPQICDALQYAHDEGVVHRDIKPENILLDKKGRVKIADFGISKLLGDDKPEKTLTGAHQVMGTLRYMAPEQMQGSHFVDHRADIYSLGVVFYELLTGKVPAGNFEPPSRKVQIDVRLDEVVLRTLAQEPDKRYQRASEVKTDVEALSKTGVVAPVKKEAPAVAQAPPASNRGLTAIVVVLLLLVLCVPLSLAALLALGVAVFWVVPNRVHTVESMDSSEPIAHPTEMVRSGRSGDPDNVTEAPNAPRLQGQKFIDDLKAENLDSAFEMLSESNWRLLGSTHEEARLAWKPSLELIPEYRRLRELAKQGIGHFDSGKFEGQERYRYMWQSWVSDPSGIDTSELVVLVTLVKYGPDWKVERLEFLKTAR